MWSGYFNLGGNEVGNTARALGYARTAECPATWLRDRDCGGLRDALGDEEYLYANITEAPWYDPDDPDLSARFLGLYIVSMEGVSNSTRTATITEKVLDGGQVGTVRHASRMVRVRAVLTAIGHDALEAGMTWLSSTLEANACGTHGEVCGEADFEFFVTCPPQGQPPEEYDELRRYLHSVTCISGPLVQQELVSKVNRDIVGYVVEFTLVAAVPWVYGVTKEIDVPPALPSVIEDVATNLEPYPSAEIAGASVVVARNLSTNPSVETNATDWTAWSTTISGTSPAAFLTSGRSTELAAGGGTASFRHRLLGDNGSTVVTDAVAGVGASNVIPLGSFATDTRMSVSIWGAAILFAGSGGTDIEELKGVIEWRNGSNAVVGSTELGVVTSDTDFNGHVFSADSLLVPATAATAHVYVLARVRWSSSSTPANNTDVRVYADTVALTIP